MFLMTDAHVADEKFLVLINDHLATGGLHGCFYIILEIKSYADIDTDAIVHATLARKCPEVVKVVRDATQVEVTREMPN